MYKLNNSNEILGYFNKMLQVKCSINIFVKRKQNSYIGAHKRGAAAGGRRPPFIGSAAKGRRSYIGVLLSLYKNLNITFDL